jgi:hypothetical protein
MKTDIEVDNSKPPLWQAAANGRLKVVKALLKAVTRKVLGCPEMQNESEKRFVRTVLHGPVLQRMNPEHEEVQSLVLALVGTSHRELLTGRWTLLA